MKKRIIRSFLCSLLSLIMMCTLTSCDYPVGNSNPANKNTGKSNPNENDTSVNPSIIPETDNDKNTSSLNIKIGDKEFTATLYDNPTTQAFLGLLPLDLDMSELNGNEKYFFLSEELPTDSKSPDSIKEGDLMLYGNNCIVIFYKSFSTRYSYTQLGHIDNPDGLAQALGSNSVQVCFSN